MNKPKYINLASMIFLLSGCWNGSDHGHNLKPIFEVDMIVISEIKRGRNDSSWTSLCDLSGLLTLRNTHAAPLYLGLNEDKEIKGCFFSYRGIHYPVISSYYLKDTLYQDESRTFHFRMPGRELKSLFAGTENCDSVFISNILKKGVFYIVQGDFDTIQSHLSSSYKLVVSDDIF